MVTTVERAAIALDGTLGDWEAQTSMVAPNMRFSALVIGDYLYAFGGLDQSNSPLGIVQRAAIDQDGVLGAWEDYGDLPAVLQSATFVATDQHVFMLGGLGFDQAHQDLTHDTIYRASIEVDSSLGDWETIGALPTTRADMAAVLDSHDLYVLGGSTVSGGQGGLQRRVDRALILPDGTLGQWNAMPDMQVPRTLFSAIPIGEYLYAFCGLTTGNELRLSSVERAPFLEDDTLPVITGLQLNGGALSTLSTAISVTVTATDSESGVAQMSFSNNGNDWGGWLSFGPAAAWTLSGGDGQKTVYARVQDGAGNTSAVVSATIELYTGLEAEYAVSINTGALFTNQTAVLLRISARPGTAQMQVSNDGGFAGAVWGPYQLQRPWTITAFGSYVIPRVVYVRYKDLSGSVSAAFQDDIILDVTPPSGSVDVGPPAASQAAKGGDASAAGLTEIEDAPYEFFLPAVFRAYCGSPGSSAVALGLSASDDVSGVAQMRVSNFPDLACSDWQPFVPQLDWLAISPSAPVYVSFRDHAENVSQIVSNAWMP
jgi:hypothetical protein